MSNIKKEAVTPRVYVVQDTNLNIAKATRFGELTSVLPHNRNVTMAPYPVIRELRIKLKDFTDDDYLLLVGDPIIIGLAMIVAAEVNRGHLQVLKYDRELRDYFVVKVDIHDKPRQVED